MAAANHKPGADGIPQRTQESGVSTVGIKLGRQVGQRPSDKKAKRVLGMHADGLSYRLIARNVGLSKNTVMDIVRRNYG
jgi:DNA invertase Pin-like site-specific DNA recombinase